MSKKEQEELHEEEVQQEEAEENVQPDASGAEEDALEQLEKQLEQKEDRLLRLQAEYDNFRRRTKQEKESAAKYRSEKLAENLLPAMDNFDRALMTEPESEEAKSLLQGMKMIYNQLNEALNTEEITVMETVGETFDPTKHEAVMQVESEEFESNVVVEELQKGYMLKDKVLRPAMVKVNA